MTGVALTALRPLAGTFLCVMGALLVGLPASYLVFHKLGYWVDFLLPVLATCLLVVVAEAIARRRLREAFGRYVSREVMSQVMSNPHSLRGERREVSILFSDLRGFTPLCEAMPVEAVAVHLNEYFAAMTEAIFTRWPARIHRLVLITPFVSLGEMARHQFWFLPTRWMLRDRMELHAGWQKFPGKTTIIVAGADELIPRAQSLRYLAATNARVSAREIAAATHNGIDLDQRFWNEVLSENP